MNEPRQIPAGRALQAAMTAAWHARRNDSARVAALTQALVELGQVPASEPEPDPRGEVAAQLLAMLAFVAGGHIAIQALYWDDPLRVRLALFLLGQLAGCATVAAGWVTQIGRRRFWRTVGWLWLTVWLATFVGSHASVEGYTELLAEGLRVPTVSFNGAVISFYGARVAAHRIQLLADRRERNANTAARRAAVEARVQALLTQKEA